MKEGHQYSKLTKLFFEKRENPTFAVQGNSAGLLRNCLFFKRFQTGVFKQMLQLPLCSDTIKAVWLKKYKGFCLSGH